MVGVAFGPVVLDLLEDRLSFVLAALRFGADRRFRLEVDAVAARMLPHSDAVVACHQRGASEPA